MPTLTGYGGVAEIGGNKFLLEDGDCRILFDFGIAFGRQGQYFNELLRPRAARGLLDPLALDLIPPLEGLYRDDLALPGLWDRFRPHPLYRNMARDGRPALDAIFVSHAHLDHNGDLSYVDPAIPVCSTRVSAMIARAMQVTGVQGTEREMVATNPREPNDSGDLVSARKGVCRSRAHHFLDGDLSPEARALWSEALTTKAFDPGEARAFSGHVGGLRVRWWPVDHSLPGAVGLAVESSQGWIGYTGDIRFHGRAGAGTRRFAEELAALRPVALLCEGTHIDDAHPVYESSVLDRAYSLMQSAQGRLVIADFGPRNLERLFTFLELAARTGRTLLALPKDIYLLRCMSLADPAFPDPKTLPRLGVYADPKAAPRAWEKDIRAEWSARTVTAEGVCRAPGDFVLAWSLWDLNDLLDLEGIAGGIYLYSNSRAYDDEQAADLDRLRNWVKRMGLTLHGDPDDPAAVSLHSSGHASGPELLDFARTVRPQVLIPIHTERPEWWTEKLAGTGIAVRPPVVGEPISVG
jgi:ribonuclease J